MITYLFRLIGVSCIILFTSSVFVVVNANIYEDNIFFTVVNEAGANLRATVNDMKDPTIWEGVCDNSVYWVACFHGWTESCDTDWMLILLQNFRKYRPGCVICINYSFFVADTSYLGYINSTSQFKEIATVIKQMFDLFFIAKFSPQKGMVWGMSYGGQLAIHIGKLLKGIIQIGHFCDPAGPGMDCNPEITLGLPVSDAAVQTQTLHVSIDKGSMVRSSQIDWLIGKCGIHQPNSTTSAPYNSLPLPYGVPMFSMDHICCPNFYNWAFDIVYKPSNMNKDCCVIGKERFPSHPELVSDGCRVGYWLKDSPDCGIPKQTSTGTTLQAWIPNACTIITATPPPQ